MRGMELIILINGHSKKEHKKGCLVRVNVPD